MGLAAAGMGLGIAGAGLSAAGTLSAGYTQQQIAQYQQQVALNNVAMLRPQIAAAAAETQYMGIKEGLKARQEIGAQTVRIGAAGVKTNVAGSAADVQKGQKMIAMMNEQAVTAAGAQKTYGLEAQAVSQGAAAGLYGYEASVAMPQAELGAAGQLVGGVGSSLLGGAKLGLG